LELNSVGQLVLQEGAGLDTPGLYFWNQRSIQSLPGIANPATILQSLDTITVKVALQEQGLVPLIYTLF